MKIYHFIFLIFFFFCQNIAANQKSTYQVLDKIVAIVEKEVVTLREFEEELKQSPGIKKKIVLENLINKKLLYQYAQKINILPSNEQIELTIDSIVRSNKITLDILKTQLQNDGISYKKFQEDIKYQLTIKNLKDNQIMPFINVSKYEIDAFLKKKATDELTIYNLQHILLIDIKNINHEKVKNVIKALEESDFSVVAEKFSDGPFASSGGNLGQKRISEIPTIFIDYVKNMKAGEVSKPILSNNGIHFVKLISLDGDSSKKKILSPQYKFKQILLKRNEINSSDELLKKINNIMNLINDGLPFDDAVTKYSDELFKSNNKLDWIDESLLIEKFKKEFKKYPENNLIGPFESDIGWHIVKIFDYRQYDITQNINKQSAVIELKRKKAEIRYKDWMANLKENSQIRILED